MEAASRRLVEAVEWRDQGSKGGGRGVGKVGRQQVWQVDYETEVVSRRLVEAAEWIPSHLPPISFAPRSEHPCPFLSSRSHKKEDEAEMSDEGRNPSTPTTASPPSNLGTGAPILLHPRCKPFEHGLLPIPKHIFSDGTQTLGPLWDKLIALIKALQISLDHAHLILDTLASVLPSDPPDPIGMANVYDLVLFLYIQTYKHLLPKAHKDSFTIVDVNYSGVVCLKW